MQLKPVLSLAELYPRLGTPVTIHTRQRLASSESLPFGEGRVIYEGVGGAHNGNGRRGRGRPELIIHSNLPILFKFFVLTFLPYYSSEPPDYSNDYDLLFNSKEVFISAKPQSLLHTQTYCILTKCNEFLTIVILKLALGRLLHNLEVLNSVSIRRSS